VTFLIEFFFRCGTETEGSSSLTCEFITNRNVPFRGPVLIRFGLACYGKMTKWRKGKLHRLSLAWEKEWRWKRNSSTRHGQDKREFYRLTGNPYPQCLPCINANNLEAQMMSKWVKHQGKKSAERVLGLKIHWILVYIKSSSPIVFNDEIHSKRWAKNNKAKSPTSAFLYTWSGSVPHVNNRQLGIQLMKWNETTKQKGCHYCLDWHDARREQSQVNFKLLGESVGIRMENLGVFLLIESE